MERDIGGVLASNIWTMFYTVPYLSQAWYLLCSLCVPDIWNKANASSFFKYCTAWRLLNHYDFHPVKKIIQISGVKVDWRALDTHFSIRSWGISFWVCVSAFLHAPRPNISSFMSATYMQPSHLTSRNKQQYSQNKPRFSWFMQLKNNSTMKPLGLL